MTRSFIRDSGSTASSSRHSSSAISTLFSPGATKRGAHACRRVLVTATITSSPFGPIHGAIHTPRPNPSPNCAFRIVAQHALRVPLRTCEQEPKRASQ